MAKNIDWKNLGFGYLQTDCYVTCGGPETKGGGRQKGGGGPTIFPFRT